MSEYKHSYKSINSFAVQITWVTTNHPSEAYSRKEVSYATGLSYDTYTTDLEICEDLFKATNTGGVFYDRLVAYAPKDRGHTAISVGDFVEVNGNKYECAEFGWRVVSKVDV